MFNYRHALRTRLAPGVRKCCVASASVPFLSMPSSLVLNYCRLPSWCTSGLRTACWLLTDWCIAVKCTSHSCSNVVKWGFSTFDKTVAKDNLHISIAALRNSKTALSVHIDEFVMKHLQWIDVLTGSWDDRAAFWKSAEVPAGMLEDIIIMDLAWSGTDLLANAAHSNDPSVLATIAGMIAHCLQWEGLSETRWGKALRRCRLLVKSLSIGIDGLWSLSINDENVGVHHMKGFSRCGAAFRHFAVVAALTPLPAENMLECLFPDADDFWVRKEEESVEDIPLALHPGRHRWRVDHLG